MRLSIIIAVLDSHEVVRRQLLHFAMMDLPINVEVILVDDGSNPPIVFPKDYPFDASETFKIITTNDNRPWSQPCARNTGALIARGDYLLMTDIDHILTKEAIMFCYSKPCDKIMFPRQWGLLDEKGNISQDLSVLFEYGLTQELFRQRGFGAGMHHNTFLMSKYIFIDLLGGYDESFCGKYGGDDTDLSNRYSILYKEGKSDRHIMGPNIYVYPDPHKDIKKIFHKLRG